MHPSGRRREVIDDLGDGDRLEDHVAEPELHALVLRVDVGGDGDDVERLEPRIGAELLKQDSAVHLRHPEVGEDQVERLHAGAYLAERVFPVHGGDDVGDAVLAEHGAQDGDVQRDVVHDEDAEFLADLAVEVDVAAGSGEAVGAFGEPDVRDADVEDRAPARLRMERDGSFHAVDEVAADGDAESGADLMGSIVLGRGGKRLHDAVFHGFVHAAAGIGNGDQEFAPVRILFTFEHESQDDLALFRELDGVVQQVEQDLPDAFRVDLDIRKVVGPFSAQDDGLARDGDVEGMQDLCGLRVEVGHDRLDHERVGFEPGEVDHAADELKQGASARGDGVAGAVAFLLVRDSLFQQLRVADDGVQRRADVVADAGEEIALRLFGGDGAVARELELAVDADDLLVLALDDHVSCLALDADGDHVRDLFEELFAESEGLVHVAGEERGDLAPFVALEEDLAGDEHSGRAVFRQREIGDVVVVQHHVSVVAEKRRVGRLQRAVDALVAVGVLVVREPVLTRAVVPVQEHVLAAEGLDEAFCDEIEQLFRFGMAEQECRDLVAEMLGIDLLFDLGNVLCDAEKEGAAVFERDRELPVREDAAVAVAPETGVLEMDKGAFLHGLGVGAADDLERPVRIEVLAAFADHFGRLHVVKDRVCLVAADVAETVDGVLHDAGQRHEVEDAAGKVALGNRIVFCLGKRKVYVLAFDRALHEAGVLLQEFLLVVGQRTLRDERHGKETPELALNAQAHPKMAEGARRTGRGLVDLEKLADADGFLLVEKPVPEHADAVDQVGDHTAAGGNAARQAAPAADEEGVGVDGDGPVLFVAARHVAVIRVQAGTDALQHFFRSGKHRILLEQQHRPFQRFAVHPAFPFLGHVQSHGKHAVFALGVPDADARRAEVPGLAVRAGHRLEMHGQLVFPGGFLVVLLKLVRLVGGEDVIVRLADRVLDAGALEIVGETPVAVQEAFALPVFQIDQDRNIVEHLIKERHPAGEDPVRPDQHQQEAEDEQENGNELVDPEEILLFGRIQAAVVREFGCARQALVQKAVDVRFILRILVAEQKVQGDVLPFMRAPGEVFRGHLRQLQFPGICRRFQVFFRRDQTHRGILQVHQVDGILHRGLEIGFDLFRGGSGVRHLVQQAQPPLAVLRVERLPEVFVAVFHVSGRHITAHGLGQDVRTVAHAGSHAVVVLVLLPGMRHVPRIFSELKRIVDEIPEQQDADYDEAEIEECIVLAVVRGLFFHGVSSPVGSAGQRLPRPSWIEGSSKPRFPAET